MNFRHLGRTGLHVSTLCLSTNHFGWRIGSRDSSAVLNRFCEIGGNFIQTHSIWGRELDLGTLSASPSEEHVGLWLRDRARPRNELVLASRILLDRETASGSDLPQLLRRNCEASLRRLQTDYLDLLLIEWNPAFLPLERLLDGLWPLVRDGLILHTGASGFSAWRLASANALAAHRSMPQFEAVQATFSLLDPRPYESEFSSLCAERNLAFLAQAPLAASVLDRRIRHSPVMGGWPATNQPTRHQLSIRERLTTVARHRGASIAQMELAWVLAHPNVTAAVVEATFADEFTNLQEATTWQLPSDELRRLREPWAPASFARPHAAATVAPEDGESRNIRTLMTTELEVLQP